MYACICRGVTELEVRGLGQAGIITPEALIASLGLDDNCCGRCLREIDSLVLMASSGEVAEQLQTMAPAVRA